MANLTEQLQSSGTWNGRQLQLLGTAIGKAVTGSHVVDNKSYARRPMQRVQFFHHYPSKKDVVALSSDAGHVHPNFLMLLYFLVILFLNFWMFPTYIYIYIIVFASYVLVHVWGEISWDIKTMTMTLQTNNENTYQYWHALCRDMSRTTDSADMKSQINCRTSAAIDMLRRPMGKVADHCC